MFPPSGGAGGSGAPASYRRAIVKRLNEIAGRKFTLRPNLYDAAQNIDDLAAVSAQLALLAEVLIKVAQDLRLLSSGPEGGFGEIILPAVQEGSSIFPGKINPVIPETMLQCCFQVLGWERATRLATRRASGRGAPAIGDDRGLARLSRHRTVAEAKRAARSFAPW